MPKVVDHDQRREEVAEATWRVIGRDGIEGATLREIAREAGFTTGVIQHYFRDREELLAFTANQIVEAALDPMETAAREHPPGLDRLRAIMAIFVPENLRAARVSVLLSFWSRAATDKRHGAIYRKQYARLRGQVRGHAVAAIEAGAIAPDRDPDDITDRLISFGDGLCIRAGLDPDRYPLARRRELIEQMLESL